MSSDSDLYCELAEIPVYSGAQFILSSSRDVRRTSSDGELAVIGTYSQLFTVACHPAPEHTNIRVTTSVADQLKNTKRSLVKYVSIYPSETFATPAQDMSDAVATFPSPSGSLLAVLRESFVEGGEKKRFVEVWKGSSLQAISDVTKLHGSFYVDGEIRFSSTHSFYLRTMLRCTCVLIFFKDGRITLVHR